MTKSINIRLSESAIHSFIHSFTNSRTRSYFANFGRGKVVPPHTHTHFLPSLLEEEEARRAEVSWWFFGGIERGGEGEGVEVQWILRRFQVIPVEQRIFHGRVA